MVCTNCGSENKDTRRFCRECGARLEILCPSCGAPVEFSVRGPDFEKLGQLAQQMADEMPVTAETKDGRLWWTLGDPGRPAAFATTLRTSVLVSTDRSWVESVVTADGAYELPPARAGGMIVDSVQDLVKRLHQDAKVL